MRVVKINVLAMLIMIPIIVLGSHFPPPSSTFQPMSIYITKATLNGSDLVSGDEIGVFDGVVCAGVEVFSRVASRSNPNSLLAYKEDNGETGFREGHKMVFKAWDASAGVEYTFDDNEVQFLDPQTGAEIGEQYFEGLGTVMVELTGSYNIANSQLTMQKVGSGSTNPGTGTHLYPTGTTVNIYATADPGHKFDYWTGEVANSTSANTTVTLDGNKTVTAYFSCIQRTLTMAVNQSGWGTTTPTSGSSQVCQGSEVAIEAEPANGYRFVNWSGPVVDPNDPTTTVHVDQNVTVTANFEPIGTTNYTLTMQVNNSSWGSTNPAVGQHTYTSGTVVSISATPVSGYKFKNWTGDVADPNSATTSVTMSGNKTVTANFERIQYTLTMQVNQTGWGTTTPPTGDHLYYSGDIVSILATPEPGYRFVNWTGSVANPNSASTTVSMTSNKTVRANFERVQYTLTIQSSSGGTTVPTAGSYTHLSGDVVAISATANSSYHFVKWEGAVNDPFAASTTVLMDQNKTISATFALNTTYPLTMSVSPSGGGTTTPSPGTYSYTAGTNVNLTATPTSGYHFVNWTGDVAGISDVGDPTVTVIMDRARNITANFAQDAPPQRTLTMQVNQAGWGTTVPSIGNHLVNQGTSVNIEALPADGYRFVEWQGAVADKYAKKTSIYIDGDKTVTAVFEHVPQYTLTLSITPTAGGSANIAAGTHTYNENSVVTLEAFPNTGYQFDYWQGDVANPNSPTTTITMSSNKSVVLHFRVIPQYTITIQAPDDPNMGYTDPAAGVYYVYENETITIRAIPKSGYEFVNWNNDPSLSNPTITVTASSNKTFKPIFKTKDDVVLTVERNDATMGDVIPSIGNHTYNYGDVINLEARPEPGYRFSHWEGDVAGIYNAETTITMNGNKKVKANFDNIMYRLFMDKSPSDGGTITPDVGTHPYKSWKTVSLTATPATGYKFTGWSGDVADRLDPTTTIVMSGDQEVKANFAPSEQYTLTLSVSPNGTGSTTPAVGTHSYNYNQVVTISATPQTDYVFKEWLGDVADRNSAQTTVKINGDKNVTAVFEAKVPDYYQLTMRVSPTNTGSTSPTAGTHNYAPGSVVTISAIPASGYHFVSWSGDVADPTSITTTVTMNATKTVTANFEAGHSEYKFTIDVYPAVGGTTNPAIGSYYHSQGTVINISASPNAGYEFDYWTGDVAAPYHQSTTVTIDSDKSVIAHFKQKTKYTLTMAKSPVEGGTVIPAVGQHEYNQGAVVTIQATPEPGYDFLRWDGEVSDLYSMTTTVTMDKNKTVTAIFQQSSKQVLLTMQVDPVAGGTTGPAPGTHTFKLYETVSIVAVPNAGYEFSHWTGGVADPYAISTTVTLDQNKTVTAHFKSGQPEQVTLTISSKPVEGGTTQPAAGSYDYNINTWVSISATPAPGYRFVGWNGDVENPQSATTRVYMGGDKSVVANFEKDGSNNVIISFNISPVETGTMAPSPGIHIYSRGEVITISAIPFDGYYFAGWYGDVITPNAQTTSVVADTNKEVTAMFKKGAPPRYNLTILVNPLGAGLTAPEVGTYTYNENEIVNIATVPSPGFVFNKWLGNVDDSESQTTKVRMTGPQTVIAMFDTLKADQYALTMNVTPPGGGITVPNIGGHAFSANQVVNIQAIPADNYRFDGWIGDVANPQSTNTSITMNGNKSVTARFVSIKHKVTMVVSPPGTGITVPSVGDTVVSDGDVITIRALPQGAYRFAYWSGDVTGDTDTRTIKVQKDLRITANFVDLDEFISQPKLFGPTHAFRKQNVDVFVRHANSNLGHNLEYQFEWGDGKTSNWIDLKSQNKENITVITTPVGGSGLPSSGQLVDFNTGSVSDVSLVVRGGQYRGLVDAWSGEEPYTDTDAADIFTNILNCQGAIGYVNTPSDVLTLDFSGLDPTKRYIIAFYSNVNRHEWRQASLVTLSGAESFDNNSSIGKDQMGNPIALDSGAPNTKLPSDNTQTGYVARFNNIVPGNDGALTVSIGYAGEEGYEFKGKYASAVMLQEFDPTTNLITMTAFNDLAWDENFYSHYYSNSGAYLIRARARCKTHPSVVSSWSDVHSIVISGCTISTTLTDGANASISKTPDAADYDYGSMITLTANAEKNWKFTHWDYNRTDTLATKVVMANDHKTFRANFAFITLVEKRDDVIPKEFSLGQNYPNPFNPITTIEYDVPTAEHVSIKIYDIRGRLVRELVDMQQPAGRYKVTWDATNSVSRKVSTGIYFYTINAGDFNLTKRMVLLK